MGLHDISTEFDSSIEVQGLRYKTGRAYVGYVLSKFGDQPGFDAGSACIAVDGGRGEGNPGAPRGARLGVRCRQLLPRGCRWAAVRQTVGQSVSQTVCQTY